MLRIKPQFLVREASVLKQPAICQLFSSIYLQRKEYNGEVSRDIWKEKQATNHISQSKAEKKKSNLKNRVKEALD